MSKSYGGVLEPGVAAGKTVWGHAAGGPGSTPYANPENILRKTGMFGVLKVVGGKVVMPTDPPDKINQFGLIDPKDIKPGDFVYYPDLLNDLQLTDHYPLLQQTAIGTVCTLNLMKQCEAFAGGGSHNNGFGKVETPEQYQARLDKLADLIIAMVKENGITAFTFQEAPNGVEGKAFYEKIERATGCKFVEDDKSRDAGLVTLFDPKKITPVLTKPGDEKSHKVVSATKEAREQQVEFSKVGGSAADKTLRVTNVHWQLDKAPAGLERMKAAMAAANDPNAKHDLLVLGDTNFCANAHAREKLKKVTGGEKNAAAHESASVAPTMIGAGATSYVEGSLSASKGGVTTADIAFGSAGMVGPSHGSVQQPLVHTGDPAFQVALEEARKDNVSKFDDKVAAKMSAVAGQKKVEADAAAKADATAKNTAAATESFDVLKGLDAAKKQKILEEAMADAAKSDALKKLGVTFADIKVAAKEADHTITMKVTFPGDKGAPPVTKDVTLTRSASADGKEVVRDCKGEGLTSEQRYAIIAAASFQERVKLGGEVNTRIAISIKSTGTPGKDGLADDERAAVKAYLAAGYTEVYCGKDNKCFTKADFKDLAAPDIRERPMQAWRAGAQGKPVSDVTFDNLMQLAKAIEGSVTEQGRVRALEDFKAAAAGYAKQCGGKAVDMVAEAVKKQADPQLAGKVAEVVGAIEKASKEADPGKVKEETQKAMDDFNGHLKPSVPPTFDPGL